MSVHLRSNTCALGRERPATRTNSSLFGAVGRDTVKVQVKQLLCHRHAMGGTYTSRYTARALSPWGLRMTCRRYRGSTMTSRLGTTPRTVGTTKSTTTTHHTNATHTHTHTHTHTQSTHKAHTHTQSTRTNPERPSTMTAPPSGAHHMNTLDDRKKLRRTLALAKWPTWYTATKAGAAYVAGPAVMHGERAGATRRAW